MSIIIGTAVNKNPFFHAIQEVKLHGSWHEFNTISV